METRGKSSCKTSFQVGIALKKVKKQGRDERTQEDYGMMAAKKVKKSTLHLLHIHSRCSVVVLCSFIPALCLYFYRPIPT